jgi:hypothetical protein
LGPSDIHPRLEDFIGVLDPNETNSVNSRKKGGDPEALQLRLVDTSCLLLYFLYWIAKESRIDDQERKDRLWAKHTATFRKANLVANELIAWRSEFYPLQGGGKDEVPVLDSIILSIILISECFLDACASLFGTELRRLEWALDNALRSRLLQAGWCPGEVWNML